MEKGKSSKSRKQRNKSKKGGMKVNEEKNKEGRRGRKEGKERGKNKIPPRIRGLVNFSHSLAHQGKVTSFFFTSLF